MMSRKLIAISPVLLIAGIIAQLLLLIVAILVYIPCLIWPKLLNWPYVWMTTGMARVMARAVVGRKRQKKEEASVLFEASTIADTRRTTVGASPVRRVSHVTMRSRGTNRKRHHERMAAAKRHGRNRVQSIHGHAGK